MKSPISTLALILAFFFNSPARAETIEFPDDELATESVLPIFDNPVSVKNRNVVTEKRFELGVQAGYNLSEPFFNQYGLGGLLSYHINEEHGISLFGTYFVPSDTTYVNQIKAADSSRTFQLEQGPRSKWLVLGNYQYTGFYGKLSFTKESVMNLSLFGSLGAGGMQIGDKIFPVVSVGLGQKFYFNSAFALRFDLRALFYQGPNVVSGNPSPLVNATKEVSASAFEKRLFIGSLLSVGAIWLVPGT